MHNLSRYPYQVLGWFFFLQLAAAFVGRSLGPLVILIGADLSLTKVQIGLLPSALFLGQFIATLPAGFLSDYFGIRKIISGLVFLVGIGFVFFTYSTNFLTAVLFVIIAGMGYGGIHPVTNKGIIEWFPPSNRGLPMGIKQMSVTLGSALASLILLPISTEVGWRITLGSVSAFLLVIALVSFLRLKNIDRNMTTEKNGLVFFLNHSFKKIIRSRKLWLINVSVLVLMGSQVCFNTYLILYLHEVKGIAIFVAGLLLAASEIGGAAGRVLWGTFSDKWFNSNRLIVLSLISLISPLSIAALSMTDSIMLMALEIILIGFSLSGFNGIWMNAACEVLPGNIGASASGFSVMIGSIGVFIIPPLFGGLIDLTGGYLIGGYFLISIMLFISLLLFIKREKTDSNHLIELKEKI